MYPMEQFLPFDYVYGLNVFGHAIASSDEMATYIKGKKILDGRTLITGFKEQQPDPSRPPVTLVTLKHIYLPPGGKQESYTTVHEYSRFLLEPNNVFQEHLRPGTFFDNKQNQLLTFVLISSNPKTANRAPVVTEPVWMNETGWYDRGERISDPVEIVGESKNEWGEFVYRLRTPRKGSDGDYDYFGGITFEQLAQGSFGNGKLRVLHPPKTQGAMWERWMTLSTREKEQFDYQERKQHERDAVKMLAGQLRRNGGYR
jgi:hypothetical protein